jgi:hypothetical protein
MGDGDNWGNAARFSPETGSLVVGDWNGDGLDDLAYRGLCGDDGRACWRSHLSNGDGLDQPGNWGLPPAHEIAGLTTIDLTRDGRDDLVFQAPCDESLCWFAQTSEGGSFGPQTALGLVLEVTDTVEWIDFDGDGATDLVSWINTDSTSWVEVRFMRGGWLEEPVKLARFDRDVQDVTLRRRTAAAPIQAIVKLSCKEEGGCIRTLMAPSAALLVDSEHFRDARWDRPDSPQIS